MARTVEEALKGIVADLVVQIATLQATNEQLREQLAALKKAEPSPPASVESKAPDGGE